MSNLGIQERIKRDSGKVVSTIVGIAMGLTYIFVILYAEAHNFNLLRVGFDDPLLRQVASAGMVAIGACAFIIPLGLKFAWFDPARRLVGLGWYVVDLLLLFGGAIIGYAHAVNTAINPALAEVYSAWILPSAPVVMAVFLAIIALVSPEQRHKAAKLASEEALRDRYNERKIKRLDDPDLQAMIDAHADAEAEQDLVRMLTGMTSDTKVLPGMARPAKDPDPIPEVIEREAVTSPNGNHRPKG